MNFSLCNYINDYEGTGIFYVTELADLYRKGLCQLNAFVPERIHSNHLASRIQDQIHGLKLKKGVGGRLYLAHDNVIGVAAEQFLNNKQQDNDTCQVAMVARKVRKDMVAVKQMFTGEFKNNWHLSYVTKSLVNFIDMLIRGPTVLQQISEDQEVLRQSAASSIA